MTYYAEFWEIVGFLIFPAVFLLGAVFGAILAEIMRDIIASWKEGKELRRDENKKYD